MKSNVIRRTWDRGYLVEERELTPEEALEEIRKRSPSSADLMINTALASIMNGLFLDTEGILHDKENNFRCPAYHGRPLYKIIYSKGAEEAVKAAKEARYCEHCNRSGHLARKVMEAGRVLREPDAQKIFEYWRSPEDDYHLLVSGKWLVHERRGGVATFLEGTIYVWESKVLYRSLKEVPDPLMPQGIIEEDIVYFKHSLGSVTYEVPIYVTTIRRPGREKPELPPEVLEDVKPLGGDVVLYDDARGTLHVLFMTDTNRDGGKATYGVYRDGKIEWLGAVEPMDAALFFANVVTGEIFRLLAETI